MSFAHEEMKLHRLVMMTGHVDESGRLDLPSDVIAHLQSIVGSAQGSIMPDLFIAVERPVLSEAPLLMQDGAALVRVWQGDDRAGLALAQCVVCWQVGMAETAWRMALELQHNEGLPLAAHPRQPVHVPWFAVVIPPTIAGAKQGVIGILGDVGRCIAWTLIDTPLYSRSV